MTYCNLIQGLNITSITTEGLATNGGINRLRKGNRLLPHHNKLAHSLGS